MERAKRKMKAASIKLSQKALQQIENKLDNASAPQNAMIYGILRDKEGLDAGESPAHGEPHGKSFRASITWLLGFSGVAHG